MTILTMVKYEWFEEWKDTAVRKRGDEYYNYKMRFAKNLFDWACTLFPKIKDKVALISKSIKGSAEEPMEPLMLQRHIPCPPVGFPGCGDPADQHALSGCPTWSHVLG